MQQREVARAGCDGRQARRRSEKKLHLRRRQESRDRLRFLLGARQWFERRAKTAPAKQLFVGSHDGTRGVADDQRFDVGRTLEGRLAPDLVEDLRRRGINERPSIDQRRPVGRHESRKRDQPQRPVRFDDHGTPGGQRIGDGRDQIRVDSLKLRAIVDGGLGIDGKRPDTATCGVDAERVTQLLDVVGQRIACDRHHMTTHTSRRGDGEHDGAVIQHVEDQPSQSGRIHAGIGVGIRAPWIVCRHVRSRFDGGRPLRDVDARRGSARGGIRRRESSVRIWRGAVERASRDRSHEVVHRPSPRALGDVECVAVLPRIGRRPSEVNGEQLVERLLDAVEQRHLALVGGELSLPPLDDLQTPIE